MFITINLPIPHIESQFHRTIGLDCPVKESLLEHHVNGWQYTASGYGRKIPTRYKVFFENRWRRLYVMQYSNSGSPYIIVRNTEVFTNETISD